MNGKTDDPKEDWAEKTGRRIGRGLGLIALPILVFTLGRQLGWW